MTAYLYTPEQFKEEIDLLVKVKGFKFFVISSNPLLKRIRVIEYLQRFLMFLLTEK
jgi:hypothetical protein